MMHWESRFERGLVREWPTLHVHQLHSAALWDALGYRMTEGMLMIKSIRKWQSEEILDLDFLGVGVVAESEDLEAKSRRSILID